MRKIIASEYVSLDTMMDEPGLWSMPFFNDEISQYKHEELFSADALILGRVTYDGFLVAWPTSTDEFGFADRMNGLPKYVASRTRTDLDWNATVIRGDLIDEVAKLKQQSRQSLLIGGSGQLRLLVHPIVLGAGTPLFRTVPKATLTLTDTTTFSTGVVALTYQPTERDAA